MDLPEKLQSLIDDAATARKNSVGTAQPCLNILVVGEKEPTPATSKLAIALAYGRQLLERGFIAKPAVDINCKGNGSLKPLVESVIRRASPGGMVIFHNADLLNSPGFKAAPLLDEARKNGVVIVLVGARYWLEELLQKNPALALQFPTLMDVDDPNGQRKTDELRQNIVDATVLKDDVAIRRPLSFKGTGAQKKP